MIETRKQRWFQFLDGTTLKIIAMACMFIDHAGIMIFPEQVWMRCVGRIAFPIFAFQIAEGYQHTSDFRAYIRRLFLLAILSEIPYNLIHGSILYPQGQNVLFTFCISLVVIRVVDLHWQEHRVRQLLYLVGAPLAGFVLGDLFFVDYSGYGVLLVVCFWVFGKNGFGWILQLLAMIYINYRMSIHMPIQAFAVLAMLPIMMYNGKKGGGGKSFQYAVYVFYPAHVLLLAIIAFAMGYM